jgi:hypothetical protein
MDFLQQTAPQDPNIYKEYLTMHNLDDNNTNKAHYNRIIFFNRTTPNYNKFMLKESIIKDELIKNDNYKTDEQVQYFYQYIKNYHSNNEVNNNFELKTSNNLTKYDIINFKTRDDYKSCLYQIVDITPKYIIIQKLLLDILLYDNGDYMNYNYEFYYINRFNLKLDDKRIRTAIYSKSRIYNGNSFSISTLDRNINEFIYTKISDLGN